MNDVRTFSKRSAETETLIKRLLRLAVDEVVTYEELSSYVGFDVRTHRSKLDTARWRVHKDHQIVTEAVIGVGIKRCNDVAKVNLGGHFLVKSRRAAVRCVRTVVCVEQFEELPREKQVEHNRVLSQAGIIRQAMDYRNAAKIERLIETGNSKQAIPPLQCMEAFKES